MEQPRSYQRESKSCWDISGWQIMGNIFQTSAYLEDKEMKLGQGFKASLGY